MEMVGRVTEEIPKPYKISIKYIFIVITGIAIILYWRQSCTEALSTRETHRPIKNVSIKDTIKSTSIISTEETLKDPMVRKIVPYTLGSQVIRWVE